MDGKPAQITAKPDARQVAALLRKLSALAVEQLAPAMERLFTASEKHFFQLARSASESGNPQQYLDFVRDLRRGKAALGQDFATRVAAGFSRLEHAGADVDLGRGAPKDPRKQAEREAMAGETIATAREGAHEALRELHKRLLVVSPIAFDAHDVPLDPGRLVTAFVEACSVIRNEPAILKPLCGQFDQHVLRDLGALCQQANTALVEAGIPTELAPAAPRPAPKPAAPPPKAEPEADPSSGWLDAAFRSSEPLPETPAQASPFAASGVFAAPVSVVVGNAAAAPAQAPTQAPAGAVASPAGALDLREISGLLQRLRGDPGGGGGGAPAPMMAMMPSFGGGQASALLAGAAAGGNQPTVMVSGNQLAAMLSELQFASAAGGATGAAAGDSQIVDIRGAIQAIAASKGRVGMAQVDQDVVDIVTMFFDLIIEDRNLPLSIQGLISRLQLPVLKLALTDRSFFSDRTHPVRQFIDAIARLGVGWDANTKAAQDSLLAQLSTTVEELVAQPTLSGEACKVALVRLNEHANRADQRATKLERRTAEKAQAEARTAAARDAVHEALRERLDDKSLPQSVLDFLTHDWQRVLQLFYLRMGHDSPQWRDAVGMIDELVRASTAPADAGARAAWESMLPGLYQRLAAALEMTQGSGEEAQQRIDLIRAMHDAQIRAAAPPQAGVAEPVAPPAPVIVERVRIEPPPPLPPRAPRPGSASSPPPAAVGQSLSIDSLKRVDEIAVGTWFEYEEAETRVTRRIKLSARIEETRLFLFSDRTGMPVGEKQRKEFALELQLGHLRVIEETPLVERTMDRMAAALRERAGQG